MTFLSSAELDDIRSIINSSLLFGTIIIDRPSVTTNTFGEQIKTYANVGTVSGRLDPLEKQRDVFGVGTDRSDDRQWYTLSLKWNQDVASEDRITVGSKSYEVVRIHDNHDARVAKRIIVAEISND